MLFWSLLLVACTQFISLESSPAPKHLDPGPVVDVGGRHTPDRDIRLVP